MAKLADVPIVADERTPDLRFPEPTALAPPLMSLAGVAVGYEPGHPVLCGVNLRIDPDERVERCSARTATASPPSPSCWPTCCNRNGAR